MLARSLKRLVRAEEEVFDAQVSALHKLLKSTIPSNDFCATGSIEALLMNKIGEKYMCRFPCNGDAAQAIIEYCEEAPFGLGEKTVFDKTFRNGLQLTK